MKQKEWEITGHVVPYWFKAPNLAVAATVVLMLGRGNLGVRGIGFSEAMPGRLNRVQINAWAKRNLRMSMAKAEQAVAAYWVIDLINALESVRRGMPGDDGLIAPRRDLLPAALRAVDQVRQSLQGRVKRVRTGQVGHA